jgi:hypothetical protein
LACNVARLDSLDLPTGFEVSLWDRSDEQVQLS